MDEKDLKDKLLCGIMKLSAEKQNEFWAELVALGLIEEEHNEKR